MISTNAVHIMKGAVDCYTKTPVNFGTRLAMELARVEKNLFHVHGHALDFAEPEEYTLAGMVVDH